MTPVLDNPILNPRALNSEDLGKMAQVVLYNDEVNDVLHVVKCLIQVFGHVQSIAVKIMEEAHIKGRAIAEVEEKEEAIKHKEQLISFGLTAEVETI